MHRRDLLTGLAFAAVDGSAQTPVNGPPPGESLYIPKPQLVEDRRFLHDFMDEFAFVDLVTVAPTLRITHIPVWLDRGAGPYGIATTPGGAVYYASLAGSYVVIPVSPSACRLIVNQHRFA